MNEQRKNLAVNAYLNGEIELTELPIVLSIVATLEQGEKLVNIISEMEKLVDKHGQIDQLDRASSWVRSRVGDLGLSL